VNEVAEKSLEAGALSEMFGRGLIYAGVFALQSLAMIAITPLVVRSVSKSQFGHLVTALTLVQLLMVILSFGLGTAIQRTHASDSDGFRSTRGLLGVAVLIALVATVAVDSTGSYWSMTLRLGHYGDTLRAGVWSAGLTAIALLISQFFRSEDRLGAFFSVMVPLALISQLAGVAFVLLVHRSAAAYLVGNCAGDALAVLIGLFLSKPLFLSIANRHVLYSAFILALPLVPNGIAYQILNLGDRIVVQHQLGEFAVGRYQLAYNASAMIMFGLLLLNMAWLPKIFAIKSQQLRVAVLSQARDALYRLLVPLVVGITLAGPIVLRILAPPSYNINGLLLVVSIVAISAIPFSSYLSGSRVLITFGRTRSLILITPLAAVLNIVLNILLVPEWGINASALATLIGYVVLAFCANISSRRIVKLAPTRFSIWIFLGTASGISLASTLAPTSLWFMLIRICLAAFCAVWVVLGVVTLVAGTTRARHKREWQLIGHFTR
jgi:O-antigen/teichoic acid export membrane protein